MTKLINADKLIQRLRSKQPIGDIGKATIEECIAEINYAKPVKPERPKGKWIDEVNDFGEITAFHCSNCYEDTGFFTRCKSNFCPKCGADMSGVSG